MTGVQTVQAIIEIMVSGLSGIATGIGGGIKDMISALFYDTVGTGSDATTSLSTFAILVVSFAAIALAIGLSKRLFGFLTSFGKN